MKRIYLDHHSITKPDEQVVSAMLPYFTEKWGSCSQPHEEGQKLIGDLQRAYKELLSSIGASEEDAFVFTSNRSEAVNHVYDHVHRHIVRETGRHHFIALNSDEAPLLMGLKKLESYGCHLSYLDANFSSGVDVQAFIDEITPRTALVSFSLASGLTGVIQDLKGLREVLKTRGILLHLDVTHAFGKLDLNFQNLEADFITFGGDVLHGPKSSGVLVAKSSTQLTPFIVGGLEQKGLRGGTLDVASFMGFVKACELMKTHQSEMNLEVARLRDLFEKKLNREIDGAEILFKSQNRLPNISVIAFKGIHADLLLYALNKRGISACMGGNSFQKLSHLLENMGVSASMAHSAISFSFSRENTQDEVKLVVEILLEEVKRLRLMTEKLEEVYVV